MVERRQDDGEGDSGIGRLPPAEAEALPDQPHDLGDVGVGVRVGGAAPDEDQRGIAARDGAARRRQRALHPFARGADQLEIDAELVAVVDAQPLVPGGVGIEHRRDVVLGVAGGEQHAGDGDHALRAGAAEAVEAVADDRTGEFEKARFHRAAGQARGDRARHGGELRHRIGVAAAVAADHHPGFSVHPASPARLTPGTRPAQGLCMVPPVILFAFLIDVAIGDPPRLYRAVPHPVAAFGRLAAALERQLNRPLEGAGRARAWRGALATVVLVSGAAAAGWLAERALAAAPWGWGAEALLASTLIAWRGLHDAVADVARGLDAGLDEARARVGRIVGPRPRPAWTKPGWRARRSNQRART